METNFFIKNFNRCIYLVVTGISLIMISIFFYILLKITSKISNLTDITKNLSIIHTVILLSGIFIFNLLIFITLLEIYQRVKYDSISNLVKSIYQTIKLRKFLKQHQTHEDNKSFNQKANINPILKNFNSSAKHCIVDVRKNVVITIFRIPTKQQANKILKDMEQQLKEEVSNLNPTYYFSNVQRFKKYIYIKGTIR